jgi:hypothetical protein
MVRPNRTLHPQSLFDRDALEMALQRDGIKALNARKILRHVFNKDAKGVPYTPGTPIDYTQIPEFPVRGTKTLDRQFVLTTSTVVDVKDTGGDHTTKLVSFRQVVVLGGD